MNRATCYFYRLALIALGCYVVFACNQNPLWFIAVGILLLINIGEESHQIRDEHIDKFINDVKNTLNKK